MEQKIEKEFFVPQIIVFELTGVNSPSYKENPYDWQSVC